MKKALEEDGFIEGIFNILNEIKEEICKFRDNLNTYFILENYDSLVNTGRLNPYVAKLAALLGIVPICGADDGHAVLTAKAKGMKKAYLKLIDDITKKCNDTENRVLYITHIDALEKANELKEIMMSKLNFKECHITEGSGLCSSYADIGGLIISF